jgi:hypothetical protein
MATKQNTISAIENPALANQLVEEALAAPVQEVVERPEEDVQLPPDTTVKLPGGLADPFEGFIDTVEIRELTGEDEEAVAKITDAGKSLLTILERATVKIGDKSPTKDTLDSLYAGDREMILLAIRTATFGSEIALGPGPCPFCGEVQTYPVDLVKDVPVKKLNKEDQLFTVDCKIGKVQVKLPTGYVQKNMVNSSDKTTAELDTVLLAGCILSINGQPVLAQDQVRKLSIKDRRDLLKAITDRNPGPQLDQIKKPCQSCGQEVPLPLTLADLFL